MKRLEENKRKYRRNNLNAAERLALENLAKDKTIIKPADKGGAVVIMNRVDYVAEAKQQLADTNAYCHIRFDPTTHLKSVLLMVLREALIMGWIDDNLLKYLYVEHPRVPIFYTLPKIHKGIQPPPGRPIISGNGRVLEPLALFLDYILQPCVAQIPHLIKDTTHFIKEIEGKSIGETDILSLWM